MSVGTYFSLTGHAALVVWMVVGWGTDVEPLDFEITEVSVVTGEEFAALTQGVQPDQPAGAVPELDPPTIEQPAPPAPTAEQPPAETPPPTPIEPPVAETPPVAPDLSVPETVVTDAPPQVPDTPTIVTPPPSAELGASLRPVPRPAPRVAPEIVAPPPPDATLAPEVTEAATDQSEAPAKEPVDAAEDTTAPEAAADQIVTEAEDPAFAPEISTRPQVRPNRPAPAQDTAAEDPVAAAVAEAAAQAAQSTETAASNDPTPGLGGGDISDGAKADLRREIRNCWSVGSASTAALNTLITVEWVMNPDGSVDANSIQMVGFEGGGQADANVAFRIARSAIVRCQRDGGRSGYTVPADQFQSARRLRLQFDPSQMRLR